MSRSKSVRTEGPGDIAAADADLLRRDAQALPQHLRDVRRPEAVLLHLCGR